MVKVATTEVEQRLRVLVADDDDGFRKTIVRVLQREHFETAEASNGSDAIVKLVGEPFDVVVSDVNMPDGTGLDLMRAIRRRDLDVPIILMSGVPDVSSAIAAVECGVFRYLVKPFDHAALVRVVRTAARAHAFARLRREAVAVSGALAGVGDRVGLEVRFEQALDQMWLAYQPIVDARTGALFGVEALMRSNEATMPGPGAMLDAAHQLGRLHELGRRVRSLAASAIKTRDDIPALFVNLHPDDLRDSELVDASSALAQIAPRVVLEVTERTSLPTSADLAGRVARLRELGFRLAVDDIGAGYSGLTSFAELAPEVVKVDMSLVRDVDRGPLKQRTIAALCKLCHEVGVLVVAEGVESRDEHACLVSVGCDLLQGFLIARPGRELPERLHYA